MSEAFRVPYALDAKGWRVSPDQYEKKAPYACLVCGGGLALRSGERYRCHFFHLPNATCTGGESYEHKLAKELIAQRVNGGGGGLIILYKCPKCGDLREGALNPRHAKLEEPYGGIIVDVLLLNRKNEPYFAIEIKKTHEVTRDKATTFKNHRLSWGEISAAKVIENDVMLSFDRGVFHHWRPTSASERCLECLDKDIVRRAGGDRPHEIWAAAARSPHPGESLPEVPDEGRPSGRRRR